MISVVEVYNNLRDYCNKDQKGFVTPAVFNSFAGLAQQQLFNGMFSALPNAIAAKRKNMDPAREKSLYKQVEEDMAYFVDRVILTGLSVSEDTATEGDDVEVEDDQEALIFKKPADVSKIISMTTNDTDRTQIEVCYNAEKIDRILRSNLSTPTSDYPVALVSRTIEVFPSDINSVALKYYRQPRSKFAVTIGDDMQAGDTDRLSMPTYSVYTFSNSDLHYNQVDVPNLTECRNFELPEHHKNDLVIAMAGLIGISLRDEFLMTKTA